jgi:hypothetical protein
VPLSFTYSRKQTVWRVRLNGHKIGWKWTAPD